MKELGFTVKPGGVGRGLFFAGCISSDHIQQNIQPLSSEQVHRVGNFLLEKKVGEHQGSVPSRFPNCVVLFHTYISVVAP